MDKKQKSSLNLFLSAFLIVAYVICAYFFERLIGARVDSATLQTLFKISIYIIFGLVLFYATRVGEGKQIVRFSLSALVLLVIPSGYILFCQFFPSLPFSITLTMCGDVVLLAAVILGYGLPYTFTSGFELDTSAVAENGDSAETVKAEEVKKTEAFEDDNSKAAAFEAETEDAEDDTAPTLLSKDDDDDDDSDDEIDSLDDI